MFAYRFSLTNQPNIPGMTPSIYGRLQQSNDHVDGLYSCLGTNIGTMAIDTMFGGLVWLGGARHIPQPVSQRMTDTLGNGFTVGKAFNESIESRNRTLHQSHFGRWKP